MSLKNSSVKTRIPKSFKNKLKNKKIKEIYERFEKTLNINNNFAVAVSGGPDSLALAFLAKVYSIKKSYLQSFLLLTTNLDHSLP